MSSKFFEAVSKIFYENAIMLRKPLANRSYEELCKIFNVDLNLQEYEDTLKYYTQPTELLSNKIAISDFIFNQIKIDVLRNMNTIDIKSQDALQRRIDQFINAFVSNKGFIYHEFFNYLAKDQQLFKEFYEELQETIITYIEHNFSEAKTYCILNDMHSGQI